MKTSFDQEIVRKNVELLWEESGFNANRFATECNIDVSNFRKKIAGKLPWTLNDVDKFISALNVRRGWITTGTGEKFKAPDQMIEQVRKDNPVRSTRTGIPYFNVDFEMGFDLLENDTTTNPDYMIDFAPYNKCTCWCNARGNSMYPTISSGDIVALKKIEDFHLLLTGEVYGIVTVNGLRTIKRIKDNGDTLTLIPDNKEYTEQTIDKQDILHVFQVMGSVRAF